MNAVEYERMFEAEDRHWWYRSVHEVVLSFIADERRLRGRLKILDAGCGTGRLCQLMSAMGSVEGCDASGQAISFCRRRGLNGVFQADLNAADIGNCRYDVITSIDVLCHRAIRHEGLLLNKFYGALKPGGLLILQSPAYEFLRSTHDAAVHTARRYTASRLARLLRDSGFLIDTVSYRNSLLLPPIACYRLARRLFPAPAAPQDESSDVAMPQGWLNTLLYGITAAERPLLRRFPLPFGTSVFACARRPGRQT